MISMKCDPEQWDEILNTIEKGLGGEYGKSDD